MRKAQLMRRDRAVSAWLLVLSAMVVGMVFGGGYIRESNTSFAILQWLPLTGAIPPLSAASWRHFFDLYAATAQAKLYHPGLDLAGYQALYWPEWRDRLWGRLIGVVFIVPLLAFWRAGRLQRPLRPRLAAFLAFGLFEAWYGWHLTETGYAPYGVASPPPAMVAVHFLLAMGILAGLFWTALDLRAPEPLPLAARPKLRAAVALTACAIPLTMVFGALVAANHIAPPGVTSTPLIAGHVGMASLTALLALGAAVAGLRADLPQTLRDRFLVLSGLVVAQYILGMSALFSRGTTAHVSVIGLIHEINAACLLAACLWTLHGLRGAVRASAARAPSPIGA
jgi:heme a synthase